MVPTVAVASTRRSSRRSGAKDDKLARQLVQPAIAKPTRAKRAPTTRPENVETRHRSSEGIGLTPTDLPLLAAPAVPTSPATTPPQPRYPAPPTASPPPLPAPVASARALAPRDPNHTPSAIKPTHPPDASVPTPSNTDPTPTTPHPMQTAVAGPPAGSSKPETVLVCRLVYQHTAAYKRQYAGLIIGAHRRSHSLLMSVVLSFATCSRPDVPWLTTDAAFRHSVRVKCSHVQARLADRDGPHITSWLLQPNQEHVIQDGLPWELS